MFSGCDNLVSADLSGFDTSGVTDMSDLFWCCGSLTTLKFPPSFVTSTVTITHGMFFGCSSLTDLDISSFDTRSVTDMDSMFKRCSKLTISRAAISSFKLSKAQLAYTGKALRPKAVCKAKLGAKTVTVPAGSVKVTYKGNVKVGTATATVSGAGNYKGSKEPTSRTVPASCKLTSVYGFVPVVDHKNIAKGGVCAKWTKAAGAPDSYEVQVSTSKSFKGGWTKVKTITPAILKKNGTKFDGFVPKKKVRYYVRVRAVKTVSGSAYRGAWSASRSAVSK